jgi:hypothetical protein
MEGVGEGVVGVGIPLGAVGVNGDAAGGVGYCVVDEDVNSVISVATHQVAGIRLKRHIATIGRDGGVVGVVIPLGAVVVNGDAAGGVGYCVVDEDVTSVVSVATHQVAGIRIKRHIATIGRDGGVEEE